MSVDLNRRVKVLERRLQEAEVGRKRAEAAHAIFTLNGDDVTYETSRMNRPVLLRTGPTSTSAVWYAGSYLWPVSFH